MINNRLNNLRKYMQSEAVDLIIIPTSDFHDSEYVSDYFKLREYFSGFNCSVNLFFRPRAYFPVNAFVNVVDS